MFVVQKLIITTKYSDMKSNETVQHIMTAHVLSVTEDNSLKDVVTLFRKNKFRHLPVTKDGAVTGIISSTDINRLSFGALFDNQEDADEAVLDMLSIPQVMSSRPQTVAPDTPIKEVAEIFVSNGFHALPVVEGTELRGIVTTTDVIRYLLAQY